MNEKKTLNFLKELKDTCFYSIMVIEQQSNLKSKIDLLESTLKEERAKITTLQISNRISDQLITAYQKKFGDDVFTTCPSCNGVGGFEWDNGEGDCGGVGCKDCHNGLIEKKDTS